MKDIAQRLGDGPRATLATLILVFTVSVGFGVVMCLTSDPLA